MNDAQLKLRGLKLIQLEIFTDERGYFRELYSERTLAKAGLKTNFVQCNHSRSLPGVIRGLHFQVNPAQGKFVGVTRGKIWDVAVDLHPHSPTFGKHAIHELSENSGELLWIPPGFAHGFCVLGSEPADVVYLTDAPYSAEGSRGIHWADPELGIRWPIAEDIAVLSKQDRAWADFKTYRASPEF